MLYIKSIISIMVLWIFLGISLSFSKTMRIMPLGDSITDGITEGDVPARKRYGYRGPLWIKLKKSDYAANFVGSLTSGSDITPKFDVDHEGHPGWTSHEIASKVYGYLEHAKPDIILLHIGTNDHAKSTSGVESILNEIDYYEKNSGHKIRVIIAKIVNRRITDPYISSFNHNLEKLVISRWENGDILTLVDMDKDAKLTKKDYSNNTHPNNKGYAKMANVWFKEITNDYVEYTSAPVTKADSIEVATGNTVQISILSNDKDRQNDMNISSVLLSKKKNTKRADSSRKLKISAQGTWTVNSQGIVTFTPKKGFTADPTPIYYTVKDNENELSDPAKISIDYINSSLENYPTSLVNKSYIESISLDEAHSTIKFTTSIPNNGISF